MPNPTPSPPLQIDTDFPGGNAVLEEMDGDLVRLRPDLRDTEGWWFHWHFRVRGAAGRDMRFDLGEPSAIGVRGPAISLDDGRTWRWLGADSIDDTAFAYRFGPGADTVRFAMTIPYQLADLLRFVGRHLSHPCLTRVPLCVDRDGQRVDLLRIGPTDILPAYRVLLTCRHHCCESMASYELEGLLEAALREDEQGTWFRENVEILTLPMVDQAGVEAGDQGKNRRPHDHNRDYGNHGLYPTTRALRELSPKLRERQGLDVALDLHCPWIRDRGPSGYNEHIYLVGSRDPDNWHEQQRFAEFLEDAVAGPLPYEASGNLPFGQGWNMATSFAAGRKFADWAREDAGARLSSTIEFPYANVRGAEVTPDTARAFGRDLAVAIRNYLTDNRMA